MTQVWKTRCLEIKKSKKNTWEKSFVNDRNEEQDKSPNIFDFSKNLKQKRINLFSTKNSFENFFLKPENG